MANATNQADAAVSVPLTGAQFIERLQHLFPGSADLAELADTLKRLRDQPAPAAVLINLRYYQALAAERAEEVIIWRRRVEGKPELSLSPKCPEVGSWGPPAGEVKAEPAAPVPEVAQSSYGHRARKLTWLYYFGDAAPPALDWRTAPHTARLSYLENRGKRRAGIELMHSKERSATPPHFRDLLIAIARGARK